MARRKKVPRIDKTCAQCTVSFKAFRESAKYCSDSCRAYASFTRTGSPRGKLRTAVLQRDGGRCTICGAAATMVKYDHPTHPTLEGSRALCYWTAHKT